jgi:hypothetical protein
MSRNIKNVSKKMARIPKMKPGITKPVESINPLKMIAEQKLGLSNLSMSPKDKITWITIGLFGISEILPFLPIESNGIVDTIIHGICNIVVEKINSDK